MIVDAPRGPITRSKRERRKRQGKEVAELLSIVRTNESNPLAHPPLKDLSVEGKSYKADSTGLGSIGVATDKYFKNYEKKKRSKE